ncbi:hypothetical protein [uncultured Tenacibaculum sp.]|uniref:hypothetical protein n=1 Tax=uncultured Tenacibaculum sp. TaxID=174713 RepID=UPI00261DAD22|nr:hypothetical protein [uncultured Tenacibaculum sp.]
MKNLQNYSVQELSAKEIKETEGGGEWYSGGCSNGGGTQWQGPLNCVERYDPTHDMMELEFPIWTFGVDY